MEIKLPQIVSVSDYHEFDDMEKNFKQLNKRIRVKEIGFVGQYLGLVFETGTLGSPECQNLKKIIEKRSLDFQNS